MYEPSYDNWLEKERMARDPAEQSEPAEVDMRGDDWWEVADRVFQEFIEDDDVSDELIRAMIHGRRVSPSTCEIFGRRVDDALDEAARKKER